MSDVILKLLKNSDSAECSNGLDDFSVCLLNTKSFYHGLNHSLLRASLGKVKFGNCKLDVLKNYTLLRMIYSIKLFRCYFFFANGSITNI